MQDKKKQLEPEMGQRDGWNQRWFQIEKEVGQCCVLSICLFNLYAEYIMRNAGLDEAQAGIKSAGRNITNLRHTYDTTLMTKSKELKEPLDESERGE